MTPTTTLRLALRERGFSPIPCTGKRPTLSQWQTKIETSAEEIMSWPGTAGTNTGIVLGPTGALDADITHPEAADAVESFVKDWLDGRGLLPVRFGNAPKRALLFRTVKPFTTMASVVHRP